MKVLIGEGGSVKTEVIPTKKSEIYGNIAIAYGTGTEVVTTGDGDIYTISPLWTAVCRKTEGEWKVLRAPCRRIGV